MYEIETNDTGDTIRDDFLGLSRFCSWPSINILLNHRRGHCRKGDIMPDVRNGISSRKTIFSFLKIGT